VLFQALAEMYSPVTTTKCYVKFLKANNYYQNMNVPQYFELLFAGKLFELRLIG